MASNDLVFSRAPLSNPAQLVFGDDGSPDLTLTLNARFPLAFSAHIDNDVLVELDAHFPAMTFTADATVVTRATVRTVSQLATDFQSAARLDVGVEAEHDEAAARESGTAPRYRRALRMNAHVAPRHQRGIARKSAGPQARHTSAQRVGTWSLRQGFQTGLRDRRPDVSSRFDDALRLNGQLESAFQDRYRDRRPRLETDFQNATHLSIQRNWTAANGVRYLDDWLSPFQNAIQPAVGIMQPPEPPQPEPCYEPDPNLVFQQSRVSNPAHLLFMCDYGDELPPGGVVVPIRRVYIVINDVHLLRVDPLREIPTLSMSLSIDCDSWTWGFSASVPADQLQYLTPSGGEPVELEASINGNTYRVLAERLSRERSFNVATVRISGRGKSALLASPYSPVRAFTNSQARTAQQLMNDVLTTNNVPIGWTVDWQIDDWLVPAGVFSANGSYMDGLLQISNAVGAYIQPHPTSQMLTIRHKYPSAPWDWGSISPDIVLPSAVTTREGIEWVDKPEYNRVYVSGVSQGILARVTRTGTSGGKAKPMITDALIVASNAARQRGRAELSDTGRVANVSLRLPVLAETGVIAPGRFVRYDDGGDTHSGIVRSTSIDTGYPEVWQSIVVETHP